VKIKLLLLSSSSFLLFFKHSIYATFLTGNGVMNKILNLVYKIVDHTLPRIHKHPFLLSCTRMGKDL